MKATEAGKFTNLHRLSSPFKSPCKFAICIHEFTDQSCKFEVSYQDSSSEKEIVLPLPDRQHHSYLDFFEKLAASIGLSAPLNRQKNDKKPPFKAEYREILTDNINDKVLYGYGDPAVVRFEGENCPIFYLVVTSNDAPDSFPILKSSDLTSWEFVGFIFPAGHKPDWAADGEYISDYWAPEMYFIENEYRLYFVARDKNSYELCIGLARAASPDGPFIPDSAPLLKGNVIDPHFYVENNEAYLLWKEDNNDIWPLKLLQLLHRSPRLISSLFEEASEIKTAVFISTLLPWLETLPSMERFLVQQVLIESVIRSYKPFCSRLEKLKAEYPELTSDISELLQYMKTPMFAQKLAKDGSSLIGERVKIIENDLDWEAHLVEGMWVTTNNNKYYLFYAGNDFSTDHYGIGVAVSDSLLGPYKKADKPFLQSTEKWRAPGHPSVVTDLNGNKMMFLHAYQPGKAGYKEFRALLAIPLIFKQNEVLIAKA